MSNKKIQPQRRSLQDRIEAAIADDENIQIAGISPDVTEEPQDMLPKSVSETSGPQSVTPEPNPQENVAPASQAADRAGQSEALLTKKATTIMPKEVFNKLQMYCVETDTPKHRALYLFLVDGLHAKGAISAEEYNRYRDMAALLTTTYEKK